MQDKKAIKTIQLKKGEKSYAFNQKLLKEFKKGKKYYVTLVAKGKGEYRNSKAVKSNSIKIK